MKTKVETAKAPSAIGPYSQAIRSHETVYLSGQIPLDPKTMQLVTGDIAAQTQQVMKNLQAVCEEASGSLNAIVKLTIFLTDFAHFATVNEVMMQFFQLPYPARSTIQVSALPKEAQIEIEGVMVLNHNA